MTSPQDEQDITGLIRRWGAGDRQAGDTLFTVVMPELRAIAGRLMRRERSDHTLQPTALVNEIYFRLSRAREIDWHDRKHFFALVARAMRHCLIDYAKAHPNVTFQPLEDCCLQQPSAPFDREFELHLNKLVEGLAQVNPELASVVEYKYYLGLTNEEAAELMGLGLRTFKRRWQEAREWLFERLGGVNDAGDS